MKVLRRQLELVRVILRSLRVESASRTCLEQACGVSRGRFDVVFDDFLRGDGYVVKGLGYRGAYQITVRGRKMLEVLTSAG